MKEIIPFKKELLFKTKISEITDISIEHDYKILDDMVEGEFILEGTYKITEASVITEDFFYKIPFSIAITDNYKKETIDLTIDDFSYEIKNDSTLNLSIAMNFECEEKDMELEEIIDEVLEDDVIDIEDEEKDERDIEETIELEELEEIQEVDEIEEPATEEDIKNIIDSVKEKNDYVTYKVYIAKENDSIETISLKYDVEISQLKKYNNSENINVGDKIIIPYKFNE